MCTPRAGLLGPRLTRLLLATVLLVAAPACVHVPAFLPGPVDLGVPLRVIGPAGVLAADTTQALVADMTTGGGPHVLGGHLAFAQAVTGAPLFVGNAATPLVDGPAALAAMQQAIAAAQDHVNLETFVFADDGAGRRMAALLARKQAEGVQVNLLYDSLGSEKTPRAFFDQLAAAGIAVREFNPIAQGLVAYLHRNHRKILIVDGRVAFTGGINISDRYGVSSRAYRREHQTPSASAGVRDTSVEIRGPAVAAFQRLFLATWQRLPGPPPPARDYFPPLPSAGAAMMRVVGSDPRGARGAMYLTLLSALQQASMSAYLTTAFFVPDRQLLDALIGAARRGVDVQLLVPGFTDHPVVQAAGRAHYRELLCAGVRIYEEHDVLVHAKTAVIDGVWSSVGSTNLDVWSFVRNAEVDAVVLDETFGRAMRRLFEADRDRATRIAAETWRRRPLGARILEAYARLWKGAF